MDFIQGDLSINKFAKLNGFCDAGYTWKKHVYDWHDSRNKYRHDQAAIKELESKKHIPKAVKYLIDAIYGLAEKVIKITPSSIKASEVSTLANATKTLAEACQIMSMPSTPHPTPSVTVNLNQEKIYANIEKWAEENNEEYEQQYGKSPEESSSGIDTDTG